MYFFTAVPIQRRNSSYKVHIQNSFRGWSVKIQRVSVRGVRHLLNIYGLDAGLKLFGRPSTVTGRGQKSNRRE